MKIKTKGRIGRIFGILFLFSALIPAMFSQPLGWVSYTEPGIFDALEDFDKWGTEDQFEAYLYGVQSPESNSSFLLVLKIRLYSPPTFYLKRVWIIDDENILSSGPSNEFSGEFMVWNNGPKWDPESYVDIVVKIRPQYKTIYLVAKDVYINRVDSTYHD